MTGEDACPTTQDQRFTLDVGQASWPVGAFSAACLKAAMIFHGCYNFPVEANCMERRRVVLLIAVTTGILLLSPALSAQSPAKEATVTLAISGMS